MLFAEGRSRKSLAERKNIFDISRGSLIEVDAALDIVVDLGYSKQRTDRPWQHYFEAVSKCFHL